MPLPDVDRESPPDATHLTLTSKNMSEMPGSSASKPGTNDMIWHLHRVIQTRAGHDAFVLCATETTRSAAVLLSLLSRVLSRSSPRKCEQTKSLQSSRLAGVASVVSLVLSSTASQTSLRLQALLGALEEWQMFARLWGVMDMYLEGRGIIQEHTKRKKSRSRGGSFTTTVALTQILSMATYHVLEATAWLSCKKFVGWPSHVQDKLMVWAARCWAFFTFVELGRLVVDWTRKRPKADTDGGTEWWKDWKREFLRTLMLAPFTLHWSFDGGLLPEFLVAFFGTYPSAGLLKDVWEETA
ncbi:hypothetical protein ACJZ2D_009243 [Fusarium nematophilum]